MSTSHKGDHKNLLLKLTESVNKAIFIYDLGIRSFSYVNPAFQHLWTKEGGAFDSNTDILIQHIHPEDKDYVIRNFMKLINELIDHLEVEFRLIKEGEQKWITLSAQFIKNKDGHFLAGYADDITIMKENILNAKKYASKKDSILEILAHDLAGPLSSITTVSSLIAEHSKDYDDAHLNKMINIITRTSERSIRLIREFVKQEFLESSSVELIRKRVDLVDTFRQVINQYKNSEQDIKKIFQLKSNSDKIYIEIDDYKFSQVLNNLISNSIKFTHDGGVIAVNIEDNKTTVLITVADDGIGIPKHLHDSLFDKFTKARREGIKGEPSVGLGMSIIKTIVEWHHGKIWFESEVDKGSTFFIELPKHFE